ncbi:MAG: Holliday junction resolvase RuvX [Clostridia bacterium]|jgi:putative Holliday junction resolvase
MRILGIDYGDTRIGIAISDPFGWTAQALETIEKKSKKEAIERIVSIINEFDVEKVVLGFPKNMNGTLGPRAEKTNKFQTALESCLSDTLFNKKPNCKTEVVKWDERLTTVSANRAMHEMNVKTSKKKGIADQISAVYILQGYLDSKA